MLPPSRTLMAGCPDLIQPARASIPRSARPNLDEGHIDLPASARPLAGLVCIDRFQHAIAAPAQVFGERLAHQYWRSTTRTVGFDSGCPPCIDPAISRAIPRYGFGMNLPGNCFFLAPAADKNRHLWVFGANKLGKSDRRALHFGFG
ncbi:hypothetical protein P0R31_05585 [Bradyrhizobium yuanmingense]|uniref:hypothetical protein n=1 Tax=Bradyrhizobium yuanmingense TaxID=108015 RepID=UPI0023B90067|nr:hypothetical protein [Bradyrhizobium yuanmingense]MDF0516705.1 hypothetical protein [Bradyrhizobium yuanmingense]